MKVTIFISPFCLPYSASCLPSDQGGADPDTGSSVKLEELSSI
jgi:hypothetical protein